ncbi:uncharacterized protein LOC107767902 [Nicotiana tabacum]|uniref:Uncharacterized protein LOC107767902 n=1 Tax=Nicotiana tabacum TaxID=4097 RepID=A0AC58UPE7_TOBAC
MVDKIRNTEFETIALNEECSARVQSKLPPKLKDPRSFTIPLSLGKQEVGRALYEEMPIIIGGPFLATGGTIIDVREWKFKMRVGDEEITFNVYKALKLPKYYDELCIITVVEVKGI